MNMLWIVGTLVLMVLVLIAPLWLIAAVAVLVGIAVLWRRRRIKQGRKPGLSAVEASLAAALVCMAVVILAVVMGIYYLTRWWEYLGDDAPGDGAGYYWCNSDPDAPVFVVNEGTRDEPAWMVQHLSGKGDGYHALKFSDCRFSNRLQSPFED